MNESMWVTVMLATTSLTVIVAMVVVALRANRFASLRHHLVLITAGTALLLPFVAPVLPAAFRWSAPAPPFLRSLQIRHSVETAAPAVSGAASDPIPHATAPRDQGTNAQPSTRRPVARPVPLPRILITIQIAGFVMLLAWKLREYVSVLLIGKRAHASDALACELERLKRRMPDSIRAARIAISERIFIPITFGFIDPLIVLPVGAGKWAVDQRESILLHELAHVRRGDTGAIWILSAAKALYWWNPIFWWLERRAHLDAEIAADALAIESGVDSFRYARHLVDAARMLGAARTSAVALPVTGSDLARRVDALCDARRTRGLVPKWRARAVMAFVAVTAVAFATPRYGGGRSTTSDLVDSVMALLTDPHPMVRRSAINTARDLSMLDDGRVAAAVRERLRDADADVRATAGIVLGLRAPKPNLELRSTAVPRRAPASGEIAQLRRMMTSGDPRLREKAVRELDAIDHPAVAEIAGAALSSDGSPHVRASAASVLGRFGTSSALPRLTAALNDSSKHVRQTAAGALGDLGDPDAVDSLVGALDDAEEHVRQTAAGSLGRIGNPAALHALIRATRDPDEHVRQAAVDAVGDLRDRAATAALVAALDDPNPFVRAGALNSLVEVHGSGNRRGE